VNAARKRWAVRHAKGGPSGMRTKAIVESDRNSCKLNIQSISELHG